MLTHFAVIDVAEHSGAIVTRDSDDAWTPENPGGWTYQEVTGGHGTVLYEGPDRAEAERQLDGWLDDCPAKRGGPCYTHGEASL